MVSFVSKRLPFSARVDSPIDWRFIPSVKRQAVIILFPLDAIDDHWPRRSRQILRPHAHERPAVAQTRTRAITQQDRAAALLRQLFDALAQIHRLADRGKFAAHERLAFVALHRRAE